MKSIRILSIVALLAASCHAAAQEGVYLPVYSREASSASLHVATFDGAKSWTFPASYTGHRSVCWLPGASTNSAFVAWVGGDAYAAGDPFGFTAAAGGDNTQAIDLTRVSPISTRIKLWEAAASDRNAALGILEELPDFYVVSSLGDMTNNVNVKTLPSLDGVRVRVLRLLLDGVKVANLNKPVRVLVDRTFDRRARDFIHEGDLVEDAELDVDWTYLMDDFAVKPSYTKITNMTYAVVFGDGRLRSPYNQNEPIRAHPIVITRRFENDRTAPTAVSCVTNGATAAAFTFRIDNEDRWASEFGSTYTAFKVCAYAISDTTAISSAMSAVDGTTMYIEVAKESIGLVPSQSEQASILSQIEYYRATTNKVQGANSVVVECSSAISSISVAIANFIVPAIASVSNIVAGAGGDVSAFTNASAQVAGAQQNISNAQWYYNRIGTVTAENAESVVSNCLNIATQLTRAVNKIDSAVAIAKSTVAPSDTGFRRMPPQQADGSYRWTAPAAWAASRPKWKLWRVFTYNAKFKTDDVGSAFMQFTP